MTDLFNRVECLRRETLELIHESKRVYSDTRDVVAQSQHQRQIRNAHRRLALEHRKPSKHTKGL